MDLTIINRFDKNKGNFLTKLLYVKLFEELNLFIYKKHAFSSCEQGNPEEWKR